jgi:hypothetical protein
MDIATARSGAALRQLWNAEIPQRLEVLRSPVKHWLLLRSSQLGDPPRLDWVVRDPVVGCLSAALYGLSGRTLWDSQSPDCQLFSQVYFRNLTWWVKARRRLVEISGRLDEQGIVCLPLKGASLQDQVYGDVSLDALPESAWPTELMFLDRHGLVFELHRHLVSTPWFLPAYRVDMGAVWERSQLLLGQRSLSCVDMLAHLCLHAAMHGLQSMQTFFDIDVWVRSLPENWEWSRFIKLVENWQLRSAAYHALSFSQYFMGTPLPAEVLSHLDPGWAARLRVRYVLTSDALLRDRPSMGKRYRTLVKLMLVDRFPSIVRVLVQVLKPPPDRRLAKQAGSGSLFQHWKHIWKVILRGD